LPWPQNSRVNGTASSENPTRFQTKKVKTPKTFSDQNSSKTIPFGVAHTYTASIGEYPPSRHLSDSRFVASSIAVLHL